MLQAWIPNTLPLPYPIEILPEAVLPEAKETEERSAPTAVPEVPLKLPEQTIDENDLFPKGKVVKFFTHQGYGFIKTPSGKDVYFNLAEADIVGAKGKELLQTGMVVGYDLSHTSHGLHVKKMKIY